MLAPVSTEVRKFRLSSLFTIIYEQSLRFWNLDTDLDVPWSEPVLVQDPFEGEFIGIFDRHFFYSRVLNTRARLEVVSLWSPDTIRFLLAYRDRDCNFSSTFYHQTLSRDYWASNAALKITDVYLKLGEEVFRLKSNNSFRHDLEG